MFSIREKIAKRYPDVPYEEWHKNLWKQFRIQMALSVGVMVVTGLITVWLIVR